MCLQYSLKYLKAFESFTLFFNLSLNYFVIIFTGTVVYIQSSPKQSMSVIEDIPSVKSLAEAAKLKFQKQFPGHTPTLLACAPGRVNIIGEHTDYNDGFVFPMVCYLYINLQI